MLTKIVADDPSNKLTNGMGSSNWEDAVLSVASKHEHLPKNITQFALTCIYTLAIIWILTDNN